MPFISFSNLLLWLAKKFGNVLIVILMYLLLLLLFPTFQRPETIEYSSKYKCE